MGKRETLKKVVEFIRNQSESVSVKDIAEALDISKSYARQLAVEAREEGLINGVKSKPVIGYIFSPRGRARTDGGDRDGELRVITTRAGLLQAVRDYAPNRLGEAQSKSLKDLRKFVRDNVADGTTVVANAWEFSS